MGIGILECEYGPGAGVSLAICIFIWGGSTMLILEVSGSSYTCFGKREVSAESKKEKECAHKARHPVFSLVKYLGTYRRNWAFYWPNSAPPWPYMYIPKVGRCLQG